MSTFVIIVCVTVEAGMTTTVPELVMAWPGPVVDSFVTTVVSVTEIVEADTMVDGGRVAVAVSVVEVVFVTVQRLV
jgi:hypothetical protein